MKIKSWRVECGWYEAEHRRGEKYRTVKMTLYIHPEIPKDTTLKNTLTVAQLEQLKELINKEILRPGDVKKIEVTPLLDFLTITAECKKPTGEYKWRYVNVCDTLIKDIALILA